MNTNIDDLEELKKKYNQIIFSLNDIINVYEEIIEKSNGIQNIINVLYLKTLKDDYISKKDLLIYEKNNILNNIQNLCEHDFIDDTIDIDPDRSKTITYCIICGFTKN